MADPDKNLSYEVYTLITRYLKDPEFQEKIHSMLTNPEGRISGLGYNHRLIDYIRAISTRSIDPANPTRLAIKPPYTKEKVSRLFKDFAKDPQGLYQLTKNLQSGKGYFSDQENEIVAKAAQEKNPSRSHQLFQQLVERRLQQTTQASEIAQANPPSTNQEPNPLTAALQVPGSLMDSADKPEAMIIKPQALAKGIHLPAGLQGIITKTKVFAKKNITRYVLPTVVVPKLYHLFMDAIGVKAPTQSQTEQRQQPAATNQPTIPGRGALDQVLSTGKTFNRYTATGTKLQGLASNSQIWIKKLGARYFSPNAVGSFFSGAIGSVFGFGVGGPVGAVAGGVGGAVAFPEAMRRGGGSLFLKAGGNLANMLGRGLLALSRVSVAAVSVKFVVIGVAIFIVAGLFLLTGGGLLESAALFPPYDSTVVTGPESGSVPGEGGYPPTADNCGGKYSLKNPIGNFGDPNCDFDKEKLYALLKQYDPSNADYWFLTVVRCESGYNPNAYADPIIVGTPDAAGAWGLYQMGRGKNGQYDHGDVSWQLQTTNAINYNANLAQLGLSWRYWECAKDRW